MNGPRRTVLFVPVSGPQGSGEYVRCLVVAQALAAARPDVDIHFVLNRAARYASEVPFTTHLIDGSPTASTPAVNALLARLSPDVVVFDNAGRTAQLRRARQLGARIVFVSRRPGKRRKAFRPSWMRCLDQHWLAFPAAIDGPLGPLERLSLRVHPGVEMIELGSVYSESLQQRRVALLARVGVGDAPYVLLAPGGGGPHARSRDARGVFADAARRIAADGGIQVILVAGNNASATECPGVVALPRVMPPEMIDLLHTASVVVTNGGTTLSQALAHRKPCIAVPLADDQPFRVRRCAGLGVVVAARLDAGELSGAALALLEDGPRRADLARRAAELAVTNGAPRAVAGLIRLLDRGQSSTPSENPASSSRRE